MSDEPVSERLASAIHDIKNGLGVIVDGTDSLLRRWPSTAEDDHRLLQRMQQTGHQLRDQMAQLLALYRLDTDHYRANIDAYPVIDLLEDVRAHNSALLDGRGLALQVDCQAELIGFFDRELTLGALNNGLGNATRHARAAIRLSAHRDAGDLVIRIVDDGPGLKPEAADTGTAIDLQAGNTGLGLHFALRAAQAHRADSRRGQVTLNNAPEGGAVFELRLPQ